MLATDIMTAEVVTVSPDTTVSEIADLLLRRNISAVPVVDERNGVVGIVSRSNPIRALATGKAAPLTPVGKDDKTLQ